MKAIVLTGYGSNDVLSLQEFPEPKVGPRDVLIAVKAASINPVDFKIRAGQLRLAKGFPLPIVFGNDLAGVVSAVGAQVKEFKAGDEVYARVDKNKLGAYAERAAVDADFVALKPKSLSIQDAAGVPLVALTAWQAIFEALSVKAGEKVFVPAGAGAVGMFAVQFAKRAGAYVATSASGDGVAFAKGLGADLVLDYKKEDPYAKLAGYDAVFDVLGGEQLKSSFKILKRGGRLVSIAGMPDAEALKDMGAGGLRQWIFKMLSAPLRKMAAKHGATYRYIFMRCDGKQLTEIARLIDAGELKTRTDKVFPWNQFKEAIAYCEAGKAKGKVILSIS
jgi:alcohol dehydrogenase